MTVSFTAALLRRNNSLKNAIQQEQPENRKFIIFKMVAIGVIMVNILRLQDVRYAHFSQLVAFQACSRTRRLREKSAPDD